GCVGDVSLLPLHPQTVPRSAATTRRRRTRYINPSPSDLAEIIGQRLRPALAVHARQGGRPFRQQRSLTKQLVFVIDANGRRLHHLRSQRQQVVVARRAPVADFQLRQHQEIPLVLQVAVRQAQRAEQLG